MTGRSGLAIRRVAIPAALAIGVMAAIGQASSLTLASQRLTPVRTCVITATPATTTSVIDAEVRQAAATTNYGTATSLVVSSGSGANRRVQVMFNLGICSPAIPATATIRLATLRLYASALPAACRTLDIFRVPATWTEAGLTWNNQPFGTTINNPTASSRTDSFDIGTPAGCENLTVGAYITGATVTSDVATWVAGGATNFGWMIRDDAEGASPARTVTFSAKNLGTLSQAPQLIVSYVVVP